MIDQILHFLQDLIVQFGPWGLFTASVIEELIVPIPSALVTMAAGFFFLGGLQLSFTSLGTLLFTVVIPIAAGVAIGSLFTFGIGYFLGKPAILSFGKYIGISWSDVEKIQEYMRGHMSDELLLFIMRSIPLVPVAAVNVFCGLVRWPLSTYLLITFFGSIIRAGILVFAGWQIGSLYQEYALWISKIENVIFWIIAISIGSWFIFRYLRRNKGVIQ